eukprot:COSAG06_NODE_7276_length_2563_cov_1.798701_4_plen_64_part_00
MVLWKGKRCENKTRVCFSFFLRAGLLSYDRVLKVDPAVVRRANMALKQAAERYLATLQLVEES